MAEKFEEKRGFSFRERAEKEADKVIDKILEELDVDIDFESGAEPELLQKIEDENYSAGCTKGDQLKKRLGLALRPLNYELSDDAGGINEFSGKWAAGRINGEQLKAEIKHYISEIEK